MPQMRALGPLAMLKTLRGQPARMLDPSTFRKANRARRIPVRPRCGGERSGGHPPGSDRRSRFLPKERDRAARPGVANAQWARYGGR